MKLALHEIDEQIAQIERRIEIERVELHDAVSGCSNSIRAAMTSPKTLLALTGVGFALGNLMFRSKKPEPKKNDAPVKTAGALGLLTGVAGTAISLVGSRGWGTVANWAARRYFDRRRAARAAAALTSATRAAKPAPMPPPAPPIQPLP